MERLCREYQTLRSGISLGGRPFQYCGRLPLASSRPRPGSMIRCVSTAHLIPDGSAIRYASTGHRVSYDMPVPGIAYHTICQYRTSHKQCYACTGQRIALAYLVLGILELLLQQFVLPGTIRELSTGVRIAHG
eukprot:2618131-Rhodomonas_salina.3